MTNFFVSIFLFLTFYSCSNKKIEITADYITNENWNKVNEIAMANSIKIEKLNLKKDSALNPFSSLNQNELLNKLEVDSLFRWYANIKLRDDVSYKDKKIFFNKNNGFVWLNDVNKIRTEKLDGLERNTWYKFSNLAPFPYFIFLYVDSSRKVYRFDINQANW